MFQLSNAWRKHWKDITAVVVIIFSLGTICAVLLIDTNQVDPTQVVQPIAAVSPAKSAVGKPAVILSASPSATPTSHTVTYIVKGKNASVTYGLNQVSHVGTAPMKVTEPLKCNTDVCFYSVIATLNNNVGRAVVEIAINGKVIGKSVADESHPTAAITVNKQYEYGTTGGKWVGVPS